MVSTTALSRVWVISTNLQPFCKEFACSLCLFVSSLQVLLFPPTVHKNTHVRQIGNSSNSNSKLSLHVCECEWLLSFIVALWLTWLLDQGVTCMTAGTGNPECRRMWAHNADGWIKWELFTCLDYYFLHYFTSLLESSFKIITQIHVLSSSKANEMRRQKKLLQSQSHFKWIIKKSVL